MVTRQALELLADYLEAERDEPAAVYLTGRAETARLEDARAALFALNPAALRAQAEAWAVVEAIATADPPIGAQEARLFAQKALAQAGGEG